MVVSFGSCKPKQSAYKAAYEQAKEKEMTTAPAQVEEEVIAPVSKPRTSSAAVRQERVTAVTGEDANGLRRYSVVIGSFKNKTNIININNVDNYISDSEYRALNYNVFEIANQLENYLNENK